MHAPKIDGMVDLGGCLFTASKSRHVLVFTLL